MVKIKLVRVAATAAASAGLIAGFSGVAAAYTGSGHHDNNDGSKSFSDTKVVSKNNVSLSNDVAQNATSGDATTQSTDNNKGDDWGHHHDHNNNQGNSGDATTGPATNDASFSLDASISNGGSMAGSNDHNNGGSHDDLTVDKTKVVSVNNVDISNTVVQNATSGDASASGGNNSGNATTGSASNSSSADIQLNVSN